MTSPSPKSAAVHVYDHRPNILAALLVVLMLTLFYVVQFNLRNELVESCERGNVTRSKLQEPSPAVDCENAVSRPWPF